ncbi:MAG: Gfo/Idh/MocA family oxidoreductase [Bacteroidetes bacterium]|nr:Gfo/Idh/MocA family oxidoreductase [Bacteroidota bacterium]MBK6837289.1 Gfo/Idh/MocA family oxidoreductase [Bacteroidota bacterium]MBK9523300.1 Gfo/Idh/MocA family oxidoreductase [Bacteroidota bacterium]MBK9541042.1 Gfo/Idh/MocA family oxidoreductase [Bacteroidota bacterium]MBP6401422.1 Gfo/Idh/MocA family oxidoreductase [Bacteroidia bacterium]
MEENRKVRFAVIGSGHIGKRHAEMIRRNPESELVAMVDIKPKSELGLTDLEVPFFSTADELFKAGIDIDVVSVCSPNGLHAEHTLVALDNKKHVVIEKPMGLTVADCEKIIFKALQVSRQVFCVMQNRYSPPSIWIKDVVERNLLGSIYMVQLNCYWNRDNRYYTGKNWKGSADLDGGTLFTQFSHFIDIMYWLFGDITDIQGQFKDFNHGTLTAFEDSGFVNFNFVNGGMGSINYSTSVWDTNLESSITIIGENGSIKIGGQYMNEVEYCHIHNYTMPNLPPANPANDYGTYKGSAANHHFIIENVIDTLKGRTIATTNALEGLKVVDIIERIYALRKLKKLER